MARASASGATAPCSLFSSKCPPSPSLSNSADEKQLGAPLRIGEGVTFHSLSTDSSSLHCLESPRAREPKSKRAQDAAKSGRE